MIPFSRLWKGNAALPDPVATPLSTIVAVRASAPESLAAGSVVGRCLLLRPLGEGSCGRVFQAHHKTLDISVALKLLQPTLVKDPRVHEQLKREAQLLARLNHPHVVRVWDFEDDPACPYIMMEYIEGPSLADLIEQSGRLAPDRAVQLMRQVARGLNAAWKLGIIHRDLKPANILLTRNGDAKLSDLGLAFVFGTSADSVRPTAAGTPLYAAPEHCFAPEKVDQRSDLYSLGATFYHALTGVPPFTGESVGDVMQRHACEVPVPPHHRIPGVPGGLSAIVLKMLAKEPGHRYRDYEELLTALDGQGKPVGVPGQRARATAIVPRVNLEEVMRTRAYLTQQPEQQTAANPELVSGPGNTKRTMAARLPDRPVEAIGQPVTPSRASETTQNLPQEKAPGNSKAAGDTIASLKDFTSGVADQLQKAIAAIRAGRATDAAVMLRDITRQEPDNETAWLCLAQAVGPGPEAVTIYERLHRKDPESVTARQGLLGARLAAAAADARSGNRVAAREALKRLTAEFPDLEEAWVGLARLAETPAEADLMWKNVLRMNPARAEARLALSRRGKR